MAFDIGFRFRHSTVDLEIGYSTCEPFHDVLTSVEIIRRLSLVFSDEADLHDVLISMQHFYSLRRSSHFSPQLSSR